MNEFSISRYLASCSDIQKNGHALLFQNLNLFLNCTSRIKPEPLLDEDKPAASWTLSLSLEKRSKKSLPIYLSSNPLTEIVYTDSAQVAAGPPLSNTGSFLGATPDTDISLLY